MDLGIVFVRDMLKAIPITEGSGKATMLQRVDESDLSYYELQHLLGNARIIEV